jgi:hypothetical protein
MAADIEEWIVAYAEPLRQMTDAEAIQIMRQHIEGHFRD